MAGLSGLGNVWNNIKEIDLRPLREEAQDVVRIAIVGAPGSGRAELAAALRRDPAHPAMESRTPVRVLTLENASEANQAELALVMVRLGQENNAQERRVARALADAGTPVLAIVNTAVEAQGAGSKSWTDWSGSRILYGSLLDEEFLLSELAPEVMELLPERLLSLGRHFPLFRVPIATRMINDTSLSNAAYSLSTGLAEVFPVFTVPLNVADMVVLTKAQAFLVYKLGLALGLSTQWQDYVSEFGSVLGGGFLWRQIARSLVGLIPAWGIVPKVAVAYAGTYVVGNVVLQWYLTGRHISRKQMRSLYVEALARGKNLARALVARAPRLRKQKALPQSESAQPASNAAQTCSQCGRSNNPDARFCQYCANPLQPLSPAETL